MLSLAKIILYLFEGAAVTVAIYLITKKQLQAAELFTLALSIGVTFMILDLFAPSIAAGARQGAGFGLGWGQVGGTPNPRTYYSNDNRFEGKFGQCEGGRCALPRKNIVEGMDDPVAIEYYQRWNPPYHENHMPPPIDTTQYDQGAPRVLDYDGMSRQGEEQPVEPTNEPAPMTSQVYNAGQFEYEPQLSQPVKKPKQINHIVPQGMTGKQTEGFSDYVAEDYPQQMNDPNRMQIRSQISKKLRENPFNTTVRSSTEIDGQGVYYDKENIPEVVSEIYPDPLLYSPLKPEYGYRYQLPRGWDNLEQKGLYRAFNKFRNISPDSMDCQSGPFGKYGQYNANYHYQKKNRN